MDFSRRSLLKGSVLAGYALQNTASANSFGNTKKTKALKIGVIGIGTQGRKLLGHCQRIKGVEIVAASDVWEYGLKIARDNLSRSRFSPNYYNDYFDMLENEIGLDAVIIATPDFTHHMIANICMKAGCHVYCESPIANTTANARSMLRTSRETGKLLQIGYHRRSSIYYKHLKERLSEEPFNILNNINTFYRYKKVLYTNHIKFEEKYKISQNFMKANNINTASEFHNWHLDSIRAAGPAAPFVREQADVLNWIAPGIIAKVQAKFRNDYIKSHVQESKLNIDVSTWSYLDVDLEWKTNNQTIYGKSMMHLGTSLGGIYEEFIGKFKSCRISEYKWRNSLVGERAPISYNSPLNFNGVSGIHDRYFNPCPTSRCHPKYCSGVIKEQVERFDRKALTQHHLENFFNAIRGKEYLNCPGEVAYTALMITEKICQSARTGKPVKILPEDYQIKL